ncbi:hypothetical protein BD413DRAFT_615603 [Trametes elegans]|nr:hypothetical protein BD413DRAFT_615603 [Trametes elegans]
MVSVRWRTAAIVIIIIIGAALLTFAVHIWRRQQALRRAARLPDPEMQPRFMGSYAGDPESHMPLLPADLSPPVPPKTQQPSHQRERSADIDELGFMLRPQSSRMPAPPMPSPVAAYDPARKDGVARSRGEPQDVTSMPEPSVFQRLFSNAPLLQFPKVQFGRTNTRMGRMPSLHIHFSQESTQIVSSPVEDVFPDIDRYERLPQSVASTASMLSRPFATMAASIPPLQRLSPISMLHPITHMPSIHAPATAASSPSSVAPPSVLPPSSGTQSVRSDSIGSVGHHLFTRKATGEDATSSATFSRNSSQQSRPSPGTVESAAIARGNGSASSRSSGVGGGGGSLYAPAAVRRSSTWTPNVLASYSPWKGVVQGGWANDGDGDAEGGGSSADAGPSRIESPRATSVSRMHTGRCRP